MGRLEVACRRFALLSGIQQDPANYATCFYPRGTTGQRRGMLALVTEPAGDHPALSTDASRLVHDVVARQYYADNSLSLTSGLLKALDAANSALLQYNYQEATGTEGRVPAPAPMPAIAVQGGGVRTRRSQVGLTSVLLRPDGAGIYLAQMLPTQAFVVHNGLMTALPEPPSWQTRPSKLAVLLRRVPDPSEDGQEEEEDLDTPISIPPAVLPSLPLGSSPGVEVDLLYRRVEPGDIVAVVSSSLARHIDRGLAEEIFFAGNADAVIDSLHSLATERGLAQAHACVLQLGVEETTGVDTLRVDALRPDTDFVGHAAPHPIEISSAGRPAAPTQEPPEDSAQAVDVLKGPRQWFSRLRAPAPSDEAAPAEVEAAEEESDELDVEPFPSPPEPLAQEHYVLQRPTEVLLAREHYVLQQRSLDVPPYKTREAPGQQEDNELEFDGWEDVPPVLGDNGEEPILRIAPRSAAEAPEGDVWDLRPDGRTRETEPADGRIARPKVYPAPHIFDEGDLDDEPEPPAFLTPGYSAQPKPGGWEPVRDRALAWGRNVLRSMLPESGTEGSPRGLGAARQLRIPARLLIAAGLVLLMAALAFSVYSISGRARQTTINTFLEEAKQEDLLGNQPGLSPAERQQHLTLALDKARQALQTDPQSSEAALLVEKTQSALDTLQGITRVEAKPLFDLEATDQAAPAGQEEAQSPEGASTEAGAPQAGGIVVQGNEAYVLDREKGRIYRCRIAARDCSVVLKSGDTAGGQKVGALAAMTLRVGSLVALDANMVAFVFSADTSSWQAELLGGSEGFARPKDLDTYDGNLYLLAAKPGQISKYISGRYAEPSEDWVKDPASAEQIKEPVSMGIDGAIYVLLADGKVLTMQGGKVTRTIVPKKLESSSNTDLFTSTDTQDLYLLSPSDGTVTRLSKEGQTRATFKSSAGPEALGAISAMTVDEGRGKLYLLSGRQVYEASLTARRAGVPSEAAPSDQPASRPTAAP
jgi:hypothetical protein